MPQGLGRYGIENADHVAENGSAQTFEWFLKNHLGSTMLVYGTGGTSGGLKAAYDYRSFGEQIELTSPSTGKVTENFTGKEKDDETQLDYFGARYLDPMLGMWISVDPKRQFASPYLYAGNGMNPVNGVDEKGEDFIHTYWRYTPSKQYAAGYTVYYTGTPEKPGEAIGWWSSHSGGYGTAMKPGKYKVDSKNKRDVSSLNDGSRGWKSWAYDIYKEGSKKPLRGPGGHKVMLHNDDIDPPSQEVPARGTTHGCHGILDESSSSDELKPKGNLPELLKNADEEMVPLIVEEF
jgi:RHS repeat-associated protein